MTTLTDRYGAGVEKVGSTRGGRRVRLRRLMLNAAERQGWRCMFCERQIAIWGKPAPVPEWACTVEHIVQRRDGGTDDARNIGAACWRCNHERGRIAARRSSHPSPPRSPPMTETHAPGVDPAGVRRFTWIGDDHPPGWEFAGSMDVGDPANVTWALDEGLRIGSIYDGGSGLYSEPCRADLYRRKPLTTPGGSDGR